MAEENIGRQLWLAMDITDIAVQQEIEYYQNQAKQYYPFEGKWESPTSFHITIEFIAKNENNYQKVIDALKDYELHSTQRYNPYIFGHNFCNFDMVADNHVLWMGVDYSWHLYKAKYEIYEYLRKHGVTPPHDFPEYTPHITMAYDIQGIPPIKTHKIAIPFNNITLWNSFKVNDTYNENILYKIDLK